MSDTVEFGCGLTGLIMVITVIAAWITHVVACIQKATWILMFFGIIVPPIGWIHGVMVWMDLA